MDWKICGVIDIVIIILFLLSALLGFKKGFMKKALGMVGVIVGLVVAFVFCESFAGWLKETGLIYDNIYESIFTNANNAIAEAGGGATTVEETLVNMGVWKFLAGMIAKNIPESPILLAANIAEYFTGLIMNVIAFAILFVGVLIIALILKIVAAILRGNKVIRVLDGILGIVLYAGICFLIIDFVFMVLRFLYPLEFFGSCKEFLDTDMKLLEDTFRISKYFYMHNPIYSIFNIFF